MRALSAVLPVLLLNACGTKPGADAGAGVGGGGSSSMGTGGTSTGGAAAAGGVGGAGATRSTVGATNDVQTALPPLDQHLSNVLATQGDDSAVITFDSFDGAADYRVYPLPRDGDISVDANGNVTVRNAIYRCAGHREAAAPYVDDANANNNGWLETIVDSTAHGQKVGGYSRTLADATLGYVYTEPASGRVAVYALGEPSKGADNTCGFSRWGASRVKKYTTSDSERSQMLANGARDDGIAFYVPAAADSTTTQIDTSDDGTTARYYFPEGAEAGVHPTKTTAFLVRSSAAAGTAPLMRVFYQNYCGWSHDELAVGKGAFERIYHQGSDQPLWQVLWSGITGPETLVVEALDHVCPFQGHLSPESIPAFATPGSQPLYHQPWFSIADVMAKDREVYVNGQAGPMWIWRSDQPNAGAAPGSPPPRPKAIARSFVKVAPVPHAAMDFFAGFSPNTTPETFKSAPCGSPDGNCGNKWRYLSPKFDATFITVEAQNGGDGLLSMGPVNGEFWVSYGDVAADTNGKFRLTALQKATMSADSYLHVTMEVNGYSTARRYPQILMSDRDAPIQYTLAQGHTLVVQPKADTSPWEAWPVQCDLEVCNMRTWDVNNQCPVYDLWNYKDGGGNIVRLAAGDEVGDHLMADQRTLFDVYTSTKRAYLFLDGKPYACADLPAGGAPQGSVTVTWGDVLYHSAVDQTFQGTDAFTTTEPSFHSQHMQIETRREFDNLGFSSGLSAPTWDESRFPCAAASTLHEY